jgi:hypothetical protein
VTAERVVNASFLLEEGQATAPVRVCVCVCVCARACVKVCVCVKVYACVHCADRGCRYTCVETVITLSHEAYFAVDVGFTHTVAKNMHQATGVNEICNESCRCVAVRL